ncbi:hypothetical protein [Mucilaginibacter jinjuensis]|uniref:Uncharacterized protein n=1 Tax=Mucilaginibacter jinjuensis TaxID=1176721 RepID=A0ABY7TAY4_9SPHI|nr:hypothetical protein [Mucilaginibacter jinjuensis]WCT13665.1 hypothetical protein PQO05_06915 [Mucilaginibacter jinjuensis]
MSDITEQQHYEPIKWINAAIEYLMNTSERLTVDDIKERLDVI